MSRNHQYYKTIYADPPWEERGGGEIKRGADAHYPLMKLHAIVALPVRELADPSDGCHLYLWATNYFLDSAFYVMKEWGFTYITIITWMKDRPGLGQYFRGVTEHCLFGVRGNLPWKMIDGKRAQGMTGFLAPRREHSRKPDEMRQMIERVSFEPRIELFARTQSPGWDVWGNETNKFTISNTERGNE